MGPEVCIRCSLVDPVPAKVTPWLQRLLVLLIHPVNQIQFPQGSEESVNCRSCVLRNRIRRAGVILSIQITVLSEAAVAEVRPEPMQRPFIVRQLLPFSFQASVSVPELSGEEQACAMSDVKLTLITTNLQRSRRNNCLISLKRWRPRLALSKRDAVRREREHSYGSNSILHRETPLPGRRGGRLGRDIKACLR
jgi:hypothetical protein